MMEAPYIKLADGTLIDTTNGKRVVGTEINKAFAEPSKDASTPEVSFAPTRRYLDDLPAPGKHCNAVAVVAGYTIFGLSDADIAHVIGTDVVTVELTRQTSAYLRFMDALLASLRDHDQDVVRQKLNRSAERAAKALIDLVDSGDEKIKLNASVAVLDRSVGRPADIVEHRHKMDGALTIRIIDEKDTPPVLDMELA